MEHDRQLVAASRIRLDNFLRQVEKVSFSDFEELKVLGVGCYGKVYLVRKNGTDQTYAMKVIEKNKITGDIKLTEFRRNEREIMELIQGSAFLINMVYAFQNASNLFLITDFVNGGQLSTHLRSFKNLPRDKFRIYAGELLLALERLHALGVVHRELTPQNILLDALGHLVLADFGCSKVIENGRTTSVCGTIDYMAPERARAVHIGGYGKASDWWAFGVLLFQLSTGEMPFKRSLAEDDDEIIKRRILFSQPTIPTHLDQDLCDLIKSLLIKNPNERLGGANGNASPIKYHKYFSSLIWADVAGKKYTAPIQPQLTDNQDTRYFHHSFTILPLLDTPSPVTHQHPQLFQHYSFVSPEKLTHLRQLDNPSSLGVPTLYGVLDCCTNKTLFFQKYKLLSEKIIGEGAFAICFKCESLATKEKYAVKVINVSNDITEEMRTLRACQGHENIVKLIDVVQETKYIYIVLELLEGGELFNYSTKVGRMEEDLVKEIFYQIVQGVRHMHALRVVHRDLKLENIVFSNNQNNNVKIVDFGLATIMPEISATNGEGEPVGMTSKCYTFEYAAPEVLMLDRTNFHTKKKKYTEACDLWSLGIILFKMITGEHAFDECNTSDTMTYNDGQDGGACTISHILNYLSNGAYDKSKLTKYNLSEEVKSVIIGLLTWDPKKRLNIIQLENHEWFDIQNVTLRVINNNESDDNSSDDYLSGDGLSANSDSVNELMDALLTEESESNEGSSGVLVADDEASKVAPDDEASEMTPVDGASKVTPVDELFAVAPDDEAPEVASDEEEPEIPIDEEASEVIPVDDESEAQEEIEIPVNEAISNGQEPVAEHRSVSANDPVIVISDSESEENIPNSNYDNWGPQQPWNMPQQSEQEQPWNMPQQPQPTLAGFSATFLTYQSNSHGINITAISVNTHETIYNPPAASFFFSPSRPGDIHSNNSSHSPDFSQSNRSNGLSYNNQFNFHQTTNDYMHNYRTEVDDNDPGYQENIPPSIDRINEFYEQQFSIDYQNNTRRELFGLDPNFYRNQSNFQQESHDVFEQNAPIDLSMENRSHNHQHIPDGFQERTSTGIDISNDCYRQHEMPCDFQLNTPSTNYVQPSAIERPGIPERGGITQYFNCEPIHQPQDFEDPISDEIQPSAIELPRISERNDLIEQFDSDQCTHQPQNSEGDETQPSAIEPPRLSEGNNKVENFNSEQSTNQLQDFEDPTSDETQPSEIEHHTVTEKNDMLVYSHSDQLTHQPQDFEGPTSDEMQPSEIEHPTVTEKNDMLVYFHSDQLTHQPQDFEGPTSDETQPSAIERPKISERNGSIQNFNSHQSTHHPADFDGPTSDETQSSAIERPTITERNDSTENLSSDQSLRQPPGFEGPTGDEIQRYLDISECTSTKEEVQSTSSKPEQRLLNPTTSCMFPFCTECMSYKNNLQLRRISIAPQIFSISMGLLGASDKIAAQDHYKIIFNERSENEDVSLKKIPSRPSAPTSTAFSVVKRSIVSSANQAFPPPPPKISSSVPARKRTYKKSHPYKRKPPES